MAELVDALASGASDHLVLEVRSSPGYQNYAPLHYKDDSSSVPSNARA